MCDNENEEAIANMPCGEVRFIAIDLIVTTFQRL